MIIKCSRSDDIVETSEVVQIDLYEAEDDMVEVLLNEDFFISHEIGIFRFTVLGEIMRPQHSRKRMRFKNYSTNIVSMEKCTSLS